MERLIFDFIDASQAEQTNLAIQKLQQCQKIFDFYDPVSQLKSKEVNFIMGKLIILFSFFLFMVLFFLCGVVLLFGFDTLF